ncbi:MAG: hypothetical protein V3V13_14195 [Paracoccaceae bacterium]
MASGKFEQTVKALEEMAKDKSAINDIGSRLIKEVANAVAQDKRGAEIGEPDMELAIRKGDLVPAQLAGKVKTDIEGRAVEDFTAQLQSLVFWLRIWIRIWVRFGGGIIFRDSPLYRFEEFADRVTFDDSEIQLMNRLGKLAR